MIYKKILFIFVLFLFSSSLWAQEQGKMRSEAEILRDLRTMYWRNVWNYPEFYNDENWKLIRVESSLDKNVFTEKVKWKIKGKTVYAFSYFYPFFSRKGEVVYSWCACFPVEEPHSIPRLSFLSTCGMTLRDKFNHEAFMEQIIHSGEAIPVIVLPNPCLCMGPFYEEPQCIAEGTAVGKSMTRSLRDWREISDSSKTWRDYYPVRAYLSRAGITPFFQAPEGWNKCEDEGWIQDHFPDLLQEDRMPGELSATGDFFISLWKTPISDLLRLEQLLQKSYSLEIQPDISSTIWEEIHLTRLIREFLESSEADEAAEKQTEVLEFLELRPFPQKIVMTYHFWWLDPELHTPKMESQYDLLLLPEIPSEWHEKLLTLNEKFREIRENALKK